MYPQNDCLESDWKLFRKWIRQDKKCSGVMTDMRRSTMRDDLLEMLFQGVIQFSDLGGFSQELQDNLAAGMQRAI